MRESWKQFLQIVQGSRNLSFVVILFVCFLLLFAGCRSNSRSPVEVAEDAWSAGDCQKAAHEYESYLQKNPKSWGTDKVHFALGNVYCLCKQPAQRDPEKGQDQYRLAAEQTSDSALAVTARQRVAEIFV